MYDLKFKERCRRMYAAGVSVEEIAREVGANPDTVYRWKRDGRWDADEGATTIETLRAQISLIVKSLTDAGKKPKGKRKRAVAQEFTDAQARRLAKLTETLERLERIEDKRSGRAVKKSDRKKAIGYDELQRRAAGIEWYPHQRAFLEDLSLRRIWKKSRQIGASRVVGWEILCNSAKGENSLVVSASEHQANIILAYVTMFADLCGVQLEAGTMKGSLRLPGGGDILILATNFRTVQGFNGHVYLDEFAWVLQGKLMYDAIYGSVTKLHRRMTIFSAPFTAGTFFQQLWLEKTHWSHHFTTIHDAVKAGMPVDLDLIRLDVGDAFAYLYECQEWDDEAALLDANKLLACASASTTFVDDLRTCKGVLYNGTDIGRKRDATSSATVEELIVDGATHVYLRQLLQLRRMRLDLQQAEIEAILTGAPIKRMRIDKTGIGTHLAESVQAKFADRVEPLDFSMELKGELALNFKELVDTGRWHMPHDQRLISQFLLIKRIAKGTGVTYDSVRTAEGHADDFWACALACRGLGIVERRAGFSYKSLGKRGLGRGAMDAFAGRSRNLGVLAGGDEVWRES